jgi:hypothetical protein
VVYPAISAGYCSPLLDASINPYNPLTSAAEITDGDNIKNSQIKVNYEFNMMNYSIRDLVLLTANHHYDYILLQRSQANIHYYRNIQACLF